MLPLKSKLFFISEVSTLLPLKSKLFFISEVSAMLPLKSTLFLNVVIETISCHLEKVHCFKGNIL